MHEGEMRGENCGYKLRCEELLELLQPAGLQVGLAQRRPERQVGELRLLLLHLQKTRLYRVLDDELDGRHRALLSKSMLRRDEERLLRCREWDGTYDTVDGLVLDSGVPGHGGSEHHDERLKARCGTYQYGSIR